MSIQRFVTHLLNYYSSPIFHPSVLTAHFLFCILLLSPVIFTFYCFSLRFYSALLNCHCSLRTTHFSFIILYCSIITNHCSVLTRTTHCYLSLTFPHKIVSHFLLSIQFSILTPDFSLIGVRCALLSFHSPLLYTLHPSLVTSHSLHWLVILYCSLPTPMLTLNWSLLTLHHY